jgi:hypothetical protein
MKQVSKNESKRLDTLAAISNGFEGLMYVFKTAKKESVDSCKEIKINHSNKTKMGKVVPKTEKIIEEF